MKRSLLSVVACAWLSSLAAAQTAPPTVDRLKIDNRLSMALYSSVEAGSLSKRAVAPSVRSAELYPVIVYSDDVVAAAGVGVIPNSVERGFFTARATVGQIAQLSALESVHYIALAKRLKPLLDVSVPEIGADKLQNGSFNGVSYTGKGVIVGIIDTGIDWSDLDFRSDADPGQSRILWLWDQTVTGAPPSGYSIGAEYSQQQINAELGATAPGLVKEQDNDGHGTHVAGIAAGDGSSSSAGYKGVAPEADIIAVKTTFLDNDIVDAITYIRKKAEAAGEPFVINLSLGSQESAHDGTDVDEVGIDNELQTAGRAVAVAAGNEGNDAIHCDSIVAQGGSIVYTFAIPAYTPTAGTGNDDVWFDVWYSAGDQLSVSVKSPNGSTISAASGSQSSVETPSDGHVVISNAPGGANPDDNTKDCTIEVYDNVASNTPRAGTWTMTISGSSITQGGAFDIWLGYTEITGNDGSSPEFTSGYSFRKLVGSPGTSKKAITVGSYVTKYSWKSVKGGTYSFQGPNRTGNYSTFSSMGPTRDGRQKPEICAPGEVIASAMSKWSAPDSALIVADGKHVIMQGTSMATPHVTGLLALLLQAKPNSTSDQLRSAITSSGRKDSFTGSQVTDRWGYGKLNAVGSMQTVLSVERISGAAPKEFSLSQNYPNPFNPATEILYTLPSGFIGKVSLIVYDVLGRRVVTLVNEVEREGSYSVMWNASGSSTGVYYCALRAGGLFTAKKMELVK